MCKSWRHGPGLRLRCATRASAFTSLGPRFLICEMGLTLDPSPLSGCEDH